MKTDYEDNRKKLADRLKKEPARVPIQEVKPVVKEQPKEPESHVNFWTHTSIMDELKILSVKQKKTIKQLGTEALQDIINKYNV